MDATLAGVAERDGWMCWLCGRGVDPDAPRGSPAAASLDHVVPRARGGGRAKGGDPTGNVRLAHRRCNSRRGDRLPELEWPEHLGVLAAAPLWQALRRAERHRGSWEVVGVAATPERAGEAAAWAVERARLILGGAWEQRLASASRAQLDLTTVALRAAPAPH